MSVARRPGVPLHALARNETTATRHQKPVAAVLTFAPPDTIISPSIEQLL
jgi:hypothetical protein